jgi:hypothetical protein
VVLRYTTLASDGDTVSEVARTIYSGLQGPDVVLGTWSVKAAFPGANCAGSANCFAGDYRYGAFVQRASNGTLTYFTPWTGAGSSPWNGTSAFGAMVDVAP